MYRLAPGIKQDPEKRWGLPDRVFFACGACHILAYACIQRFPARDFRAMWIKPNAGFTGNHIVAVSGDVAVDYHGVSNWDRLLDHTRRKAQRWWPGWDCSVIELPSDVLVSEQLSKTYEGLWLREPGQFLHNALPRAEAFLTRKTEMNFPLDL